MVQMKLACIPLEEANVLLWGLDQVDVVAENIIKARRNDLKENPDIATFTQDVWKQQIRDMEKSISKADELRNYLYTVPEC